VTVEELAGRVAVVTGAASGIGRGIAGALAAQGMRIVAADLDGARLAVTGAELRGNGAEVIERVTDVRDGAAVQALAAAALEAYGAVHVICNNAGVWTLGYQWETDLADWSWVIDVNLWGVIHGVRTFVPILLRNAEAAMSSTSHLSVGLSRAR
jgi:NADP-dependent 3-hydroxy acid dehydrogenase YdfG